MQDTILLIDASDVRRRAIRHALERRGCVVAGDAGSLPEIVDMVADLEAIPATVLIGNRIRGASAGRVAMLVKRTWPNATVIRETVSEEEMSLRQASGV